MRKAHKNQEKKDAEGCRGTNFQIQPMNTAEIKILSLIHI